MRFSLFIAFILSFLLSACATSTAYQKQMHRWQGKNIQTLKTQWGRPEAVTKLPNGHMLYQYMRKSFSSIPDAKRQPLHTNDTLFKSYEEPWLSNITMVRYCRTTFETNKNGTIINISFNGNNCFAYRFIRQ
ncbi:hypothetical protein [Rickettsiella endosymbiont of Dermanyssus gallinae]|uniref:hypothetical protein n=1 Tax=Rickettsiella endosymbiont of Dermanyssus gallinae TaxID=2856608 RepID=UPI001C52EFE1|nr:hypothetical protein [Rickettsiella endosymbiont of Dermanyssus gallinae]